MDDAVVMAAPDDAGQCEEDGPQGFGRPFSEKSADLGPFGEAFGDEDGPVRESPSADLAIRDRSRRRKPGVEQRPGAGPGPAGFRGDEKRLEPGQAAKAEFLHRRIDRPSVLI